jgi:hypothetical protein
LVAKNLTNNAATIRFFPYRPTKYWYYIPQDFRISEPRSRIAIKFIYTPLHVGIFTEAFVVQIEWKESIERRLLIINSHTSKLVSTGIDFKKSELLGGTIIGKGGFGHVMKLDITDTSTGKKIPVAVKNLQIFENSLDASSELKYFRAEIIILHKLRGHPNIVKFIGTCT